MGPEDATQDVTELPFATVTFPSYRLSDPGRDALIARITDAVEDTLAPYDVSVVTARPSAGPYDMILFGGDPALLGLPDGAGATYANGCSDAAESDVGFVFDEVDGVEMASSLALALFGAAHGIPHAALHGDCMCFNPLLCPPFDAFCTIGGAGTPIDAVNSDCEGADTEMDERARFAAALGLR
jgi:hypothetical protein